MEVKLCFSKISGLNVKKDIIGIFKEVQRISGKLSALELKGHLARRLYAIVGILIIRCLNEIIMED